MNEIYLVKLIYYALKNDQNIYIMIWDKPDETIVLGDLS